MISYAKTLKILRTSHKLTQNDIAQILGIDRSTYAYYEKGATKPDFECILKLCKMYKINLDDIATMFLKDENTYVTFKTFDHEELDTDEILKELDTVNLDEYEKMILLLYRNMPESCRKLFFVKIKQSFDEISNINPDD